MLLRLAASRARRLLGRRAGAFWPFPRGHIAAEQSQLVPLFIFKTDPRPKGFFRLCSSSLSLREAEVGADVTFLRERL